MKKLLTISLLLISLLICQSGIKAALPPTMTFYLNLEQMQKGFDYLGSVQKIPTKSFVEDTDYYVSYQAVSFARYKKTSSRYLEVSIILQGKHEESFDYVIINIDLTMANIEFDKKGIYTNIDYLITFRSQNKQYLSFLFSTNIGDDLKRIAIIDQFFESINATFKEGDVQ